MTILFYQPVLTPIYTVRPILKDGFGKGLAQHKKAYASRSLGPAGEGRSKWAPKKLAYSLFGEQSWVELRRHILPLKMHQMRHESRYGTRYGTIE